MESGDILTVAVGLVIVLVIALAVNPHYLSDLPVLPPGGRPATSPMTFPVTAVTVPLPISVATSVTTVPPPTVPASAAPVPPAPPPRILYTDKPYSYPVVRLPDRLEMLGESDIRRSGQDVVTFAYVEDSRGGLTRTFSVPYPVWMMDIRVIDNTTPNIAGFRMGLCYAANGTFIDGVEIEHPGSTYKKIQTSNIPLYLIISTADIENFRIELQTSRQYFDQYGPLKP